MEPKQTVDKRSQERNVDLFGEIFSFRNVLICAFILGVMIVLMNVF